MSVDRRPLASSEVLQLTLRAVLTGMVLGAVLSLCNIYTGLKIGWGTNMSITAALLGYAMWQLVSKIGGRRSFGIEENTVSQTAASAAASISSAGLVAPIPALTMLTGQTLAWHWLSLWVLSVAAVGVVVGIGLRRQMIEVDALPFPFGIATAETLKEMYARGAEAMARVWALLAGGAVAAGLKVAKEVVPLSKLGLPGSVSLSAKGTATLKNLTFALDPSLLFIGVGALIGTRAGLSMLLGAGVGWGFLAPYVLEMGFAESGKPDPDANWFGPLVKWMLWPGVAMMVTASLTSFALSARSFLSAFRSVKGEASSASKRPDRRDFSRSTFLKVAGGVALISVVLQIFLFGIGFGVAIFGVLLTFVLAIVAARVAGETGITPVGPMGKVTQLIFGLVAPANVTTNLMAANVTGGAASQAGDMLHDMRAGYLLGVWPRHQGVSQFFGVMAGALAGSAGYLLIVPNPREMLLTKEWPAPAVAQWKAVAEVFQKGIESMPPGALTAIYVAGGIGVILALAEKLLPKAAARWVPSASSIGLALVIPAYYAIGMCLGSLIGWGLSKRFPSWSARFTVVVASGFIAGESLTGVVFAVKKIFTG